MWGGGRGKKRKERKKTISTLTACSMHFCSQSRGGKNSLGELDSRSCLVLLDNCGVFPHPYPQQVALFQE